MPSAGPREVVGATCRADRRRRLRRRLPPKLLRVLGDRRIREPAHVEQEVLREVRRELATAFDASCASLSRVRHSFELFDAMIARRVVNISRPS